LVFDVGVKLTRIIPKDSLKELSLELDEEVYCIFKPDAVRAI